LRVTAAAQAAEAAGLCVAIVLNAIDSASGNTWTTASGLGFIGFEVLFAVALAAIAAGIARVRPWSRTPSLLSQLFIALIAVWLLQAHRYAWGAPALLLAVAGLIGLFTPASFRALHRDED
jgi:cytosine/uracil/thiamine/allantoin permease